MEMIRAPLFDRQDLNNLRMHACIYCAHAGSDPATTDPVFPRYHACLVLPNKYMHGGRSTRSIVGETVLTPFLKCF